MKIAAADLRNKIDFGIITIREDEYLAVYDRLQPVDSSYGRRTYDIGMITTSDESSHYRYALIRTVSQGEGIAQDVARDMIEDLQPKMLLLVGIGGAVPSPDFTLGDVVCATRVYDFCVRAIKEGASDRFSAGGGPMHRAVENVLSRLPAIERKLLDWNTQDSIGMTMPSLYVPEKGSGFYYGTETWQEDVHKWLTHHFTLPTHNRPHVTARPVASSDALIKDTNLLDQWLTEARAVAAVEMELGGVYIAARRHDKEYPILAIRGISDIVGFKREEVWTKYACNSASAFAMALIKSGELLASHTDLVIPTPISNITKRDLVSVHHPPTTKIVPPAHSLHNELFSYDVFISYSHKDEDWVVNTLLPQLESQGQNVCIDFRDFVGGIPVLLNMQRAVNTSRHTLLIITPDWIESEWALYESILVRTKDPIGLERRTIPLKLEECEIPDFISMLTWVDFTRSDRLQYAWGQLSSALATHQNKESSSGLAPASDPIDRDAENNDYPKIPGGTISPHDLQFYVERPEDQVVIDAIKRQGVTVTIQGPRQVGKSSLLARAIDVAEKIGKRVVFLDFQLINNLTLKNENLFFSRFCAWITDELEMENKVDEFWRLSLGDSLCCTRYLGRYVLKELGKPLCIAIDEVERIFDSDFRSSFFGMLRSWHNSRRPDNVWKHLDLLLVTSTEPALFVEALNQSPFNVGEDVSLMDFTSEQFSILNHRYGSPLTHEQEQRLMILLGGHPFLMHRALYLITKERVSLDAFLTYPVAESTPFFNHLHRLLNMIENKNDLKQGLLQIIQTKTCTNELIFVRLKSAGLVRREGQLVDLRCQLYTDFFREYLHA